MKTQLIDVNVCGRAVEAYTNGMLVFKSLETAGNAVRILKGKSPMNMSKYLESDDLREYTVSLVQYANKNQLCVGSPSGKEWTRDDFIKKEGPKRTSRMLVHLNVALKIAMRMDSDFEVELIESFIAGRILEFRLMGGDEFKRLNRMLDRLSDRRGKSNIGVYIQTANKIREMCELKWDKGESPWNATTANSFAQKSRFEVQEKLCDYIEMGFIKDYEHFKEVLKSLDVRI